MHFFAQYDEHLTETERNLVARAREFCAGPFSQAVLDAYLTGEPFSADWISRWAAEGMLGLQTREEDGGTDASFICKIRVAQEMALHGFAAAFCLNNLQGQVTRVSRQGSNAQRNFLLGGLMSGELLSAPSMSEPGAGSDISGLATAALPVEGGWILNGVKAWVTNGILINQATMLVRLGETGEMASLIVPCPLDAPTIRRSEIAMPGARSFRLARLEFEGHFVPDWALLGTPGDAVRASMEAVNAARVHVAAMAVATLYSALCEATRFAAKRTAFGRPLLGHQGLQWELAEVAIRLEAASALVLKAALLVHRGQPAQTTAAQCKKFAVDTAIWGIDQCLRGMGAIGASATHRLGMQLAEVRLAAFADGTNEMMLDRVGRGLVKEYAEPLVGAGEPGQGAER